MEKLLVICGPTATGKTSLALHLAKVFDGEVVSADSRQVYKEMNIGTGKDLPVISNFQFPISNLKKQGIGCYKISGVKLWCYDLVDPKEEFSVSQYIKVAEKVIKNIWKRGKLPILVGGTGFYIKGLVDGIDTADIRKNIEIRSSLEGKGTDDLYALLTNLNPEKALLMNESDKKNPRRLIRAIEISSSKEELTELKRNKYDSLFIGLSLKKKILATKIDKRVDERISQGFIEEIQKLDNSGVDWGSNAMMASGYRQLKDYIDNKITFDEAVNIWKIAEIQYAKRQMTWFKKDKRIKWFDITKRDWKKVVENTVYKWHNKI